jgi:hypothetical protein
VDEDESPFSRVPAPGAGELRSPYTDPEAHIALYGVAAKSLKPLPLVVRVAIVIIGVAFIVGLPLLLLLN